MRALFGETSARLVDMSSAEHDRRMGLVLGLTHLANLVFARALSNSSIGATELSEVAGVTFAKQLRTTREVAAENPGLYFEIQALNQLTPETGKWLRQALEEWLATVESNDEGRFATLMRDCHAYLDGADLEGITP